MFKDEKMYKVDGITLHSEEEFNFYKEIRVGQMMSAAGWPESEEEQKEIENKFMSTVKVILL